MTDANLRAELDQLGKLLDRLDTWAEAEPLSEDGVFNGLAGELTRWYQRVYDQTTPPGPPGDPITRIHAVLDAQSETIVRFTTALRAEFGPDAHVAIVVNAPGRAKPVVERYPPLDPHDPAGGDS